MTRPAFIITLGATILCRSSTLAAPETGAPPIALEGNPTIVFADNQGVRKAVAAVKLTTARPKSDEEPSVIEFSLGDLRYSASPAPLKVKWRRAQDPANAPEAIELELDNALRRPGLYTAQIAPLPLSNPAARLQLQINIKEAKLALPQKLVIAQTNFIFGTHSIKPKLEVRETDRATRVPMLVASRTSAFAGTVPIAAGVTPQANSVNVLPGQSAEINYAVDEEVPLGTVTGALRFSAAELTEPVSLDYEVHTKLTSYLIPVIIAAGFFFGWLVRKYLVDVAQLGEAREKAKALLAQVDKSLAERPDATFRAAVTTPRDALETAQKDNKTEAITARLKELDDAWRSALIDFDHRKVAAAEKIAELKTLAGPPLPLPAVTNQRISDARNAAARAADVLARNEVAAAEDELEKEKTFPDDIWKAALSWQDEILKVIQFLQETPMGLPSSVQTQFTEKAKNLTLNRITPHGGTFNTPDLRRTLFLDFHAEFRDAGLLFSELASRLEFESNLIDKEVKDIRQGLEPEYGLLAEAIASFRRDLEDAAGDPKKFFETLGDRVQQLNTNWHAALLSKAPTATEAEKLAALNELANNRQYLQLAKNLAALLKTNAFLGAENGAASEAGLVPWPATSMGWLTPSTIYRAQARASEVPEPVERLTPEKARLLQSILLAVIYIVLYWLLFGDSFGSSWADVATLFITSFVSDLSLEGLLRLKK
jgi:hypothetical protein